MSENSEFRFEEKDQFHPFKKCAVQTKIRKLILKDQGSIQKPYKIN